jgi:hypothetical protein
MLPTAKPTSLIFAILVLAPTLLYAASVYETAEEFLARAFAGGPPEPGVAWLSGERKSSVKQLLGHDYPALRVRNWCRSGRSAWILEEVGKELPITVGIIVDNDYISSLKVLTYRENRGGEVVTPSFTEQFNGAALDPDTSLDVKIDGISGATLSVQALTRLAAMALFLHADTGCNSGR